MTDNLNQDNNLGSEQPTTSTPSPSANAMKPETAANKLGIYLPATPAEFQQTALTHAQFKQLQENPPEWLSSLRRQGPHPRKVVAQKLGISNTALKNSDLQPPLTTAEIKELLANPPQWLTKARSDMAAKREEISRREANSPANRVPATDGNTPPTDEGKREPTGFSSRKWARQ